MKLKRVFFLLCFIFFFLCLPHVSASNISSYIVFDVHSRTVLEGKNIHNKALIASTTKILTALVALESSDIMSVLEVKKEDTLIEGSKVYLQEGEHFLLIDIVYGLMLRSGNDCANLLARTYKGGYNAFMEAMNEKAKDLGMKNSNFENPSGLDELDENISTAYDMALLMSGAMKNEYFKEVASTHKYSTTSKEGRHYSWQNKDKSLFSDSRFIAGKTGYTKKSGRILVNYASAYARDVVIVTINDSADWTNHKLYLKNLESYVIYTILKKGTYQIAGYLVKIDNDIKIPMLKEKKNDYRYILYIGKKTYLHLYLDKLFISTYEVKISPIYE